MKREGQALGTGGPLGPQESFAFYTQNRGELLRVRVREQPRAQIPILKAPGALRGIDDRGQERTQEPEGGQNLGWGRRYVV